MGLGPIERTESPHFFLLPLAREEADRRRHTEKRLQRKERISRFHALDVLILAYYFSILTDCRLETVLKENARNERAKDLKRERREALSKQQRQLGKEEPKKPTGQYLSFSVVWCVRRNNCVASCYSKTFATWML